MRQWFWVIFIKIWLITFMASLVGYTWDHYGMYNVEWSGWGVTLDVHFAEMGGNYGHGKKFWTI